MRLHPFASGALAPPETAQHPHPEPMDIDLQIGGYRIRFSEPKELATTHWPQWMYEPFEVPINGPLDIDYDLIVTYNLPQPKHPQLLFHADHGYWSLYSTAQGLMIETLKTKTQKPLTRAFLTDDFSKMTVYTKPNRRLAGQTTWAPARVLNPLLEIGFLTRLAREGGALLHASGVLTKEGAWVFAGPSGAGKSTIGDFFAQKGYAVLSDERMILRRTPNGIYAYGSPWPGESHIVKNDQGPLERLFFIRHGQHEHRVREMTSFEISQFFLKQCFLPLWDRAAMEETTRFLDEIQNQIPCYDLAPLKDPGVVDFLSAFEFSKSR